MEKHPKLLRLIFNCLLAVLLMWPLAGRAQVQPPMPVSGCFTDHGTADLRTMYPNGVPGRTLPIAAKVVETDEYFIYHIPVVVHIMHAYGPEQNVTADMIHSQIAQLNACYGRYGNGANTNPLSKEVLIRFCLATLDPEGRPHLGYDYTVTQMAVDLDPFTQDTILKKMAMWDPNRYLNIWTVRRIAGGQYEGYAYLPEDVAGTSYDGIVVRYGSMGVFPVGIADTYGKTVVHEAGHYLGLYHPWGLIESDCFDTHEDYCDDTPPVPELYFATWPNCYPTDACDGNLRLVENYMDYADDLCQNMFTVCQADRMLDHVLSYRAQLVSSENLRATGCAQALDSLPSIEKVLVYPVPSSSYMTIMVDMEGTGAVNVEVVDLTGRMVYREKAAGYGRGPIPLDVSMFAQGNYMLHVWSNTFNLAQMIQVED